MSVELITPQTDAATATDIRVYGASIPCTFIATDLGAAEPIAVKIRAVDADTYESTSVTLTNVNNVITITTPGTYEFAKGVTVATAGLYMTSETHR